MISTDSDEADEEKISTIGMVEWWACALGNDKETHFCRAAAGGGPVNGRLSEAEQMLAGEKLRLITSTGTK